MRCGRLLAHSRAGHQRSPSCAVRRRRNSRIPIGVGALGGGVDSVVSGRQPRVAGATGELTRSGRRVALWARKGRTPVTLQCIGGHRRLAWRCALGFCRGGRWLKDGKDRGAGVDDEGQGVPTTARWGSEHYRPVGRLETGSEKTAAHSTVRLGPLRRASTQHPPGRHPKRPCRRTRGASRPRQLAFQVRWVLTTYPGKPSVT